MLNRCSLIETAREYSPRLGQWRRMNKLKGNDCSDWQLG